MFAAFCLSFAQPLLVTPYLDAVVVNFVYYRKREGAQKLRPKLPAEIPQYKVAVAFYGNPAEGSLPSGRQVYAADRPLVYEVVNMPLRAPELFRDFAHRQRRPVDEIERVKGEFKLERSVRHDYRHLICFAL